LIFLRGAAKTKVLTNASRRREVIMQQVRKVAVGRFG